MARKKRRNPGFTAYIKQLFSEHRDWLDSRSNALIVDRFTSDHPGKEFTSRMKQSLANIKSNLRKMERDGTLDLGPSHAAAATTPVAVSTNKDELTKLEILIDDAMMLAKSISREKLARVVEHLREARNLVVWKQGK